MGNTIPYTGGIINAVASSVGIGQEASTGGIIKTVASSAGIVGGRIKAVASSAGIGQEASTGGIIKAVASSAGIVGGRIKAVASSAGIGQEAITGGIIMAVASSAGIGLLSWGISQLFRMWGIPTIFGIPVPWITRKIMKAPGRDGFIYRDVFEGDPASYFRGLRK